MYLFIITYKISCVLFDILIKKRYLSNVKGKGYVIKSYSSTGANINAQKRVTKCWNKKRALILEY